MRYEVNAVMHIYVAEQPKDLLATRHGVRACMGVSKCNGKPKKSSYYVSTRTTHTYIRMCIASLHLHLRLYFNIHRCKYVRDTIRVVEFV